MDDYNRYGYSHSYGHAPPPPPSAPPITTAAATSSYSASYSAYPPPQQGYPPAAAAAPYPSPWGGGGGVSFPAGTHPEVIRAFRAVDRDGSGSIEERELQEALSSAYHRFSIRTVRLLMFLFRSPSSPSASRMGPPEFVALWNCLGQWRAIFDRFDRDRSGKIDSEELREALGSLGYAVPPSVIEVLISNYTGRESCRGALDYDNFVECGMIVKGLTEKFKERDPRYTGSATLTYDGFMSMVIPFIAP